MKLVKKVTTSVDENGTIRYSRGGKLHREDGPAIEWEDGGTWWYRNGDLHRIGGPAIEENYQLTPELYQEWWYKGYHLEFNDYVKRAFPKESAEKTIFLLKYSGNNESTY